MNGNPVIAGVREGQDKVSECKGNVPSRMNGPVFQLDERHRKRHLSSETRSTNLAEIYAT